MLIPYEVIFSIGNLAHCKCVFNSIPKNIVEVEGSVVFSIDSGIPMSRHIYLNSFKSSLHRCSVGAINKKSSR